MFSRHSYEYSTVGHSSHGLMQCAACGKKIKEGDYRAHKKSKSSDWKYVAIHRACCTDDLEWSKVDTQRRDSAEKHQRFVAACVAFRDEWGINDLDHYIEGGTTK